MSQYKLFNIIKNHCSGLTPFAQDDCFEIVARESNIPMESIILSLRPIQAQGLIKFSTTGKYIQLTEVGVRM